MKHAMKKQKTKQTTKLPPHILITVFDRFIKIHPYFCTDINISSYMQIFDNKTVPTETDMISKLKWYNPEAWNSIFPFNLSRNFQFAVTIFGSPSGSERSHFVSLSEMGVQHESWVSERRSPLTTAHFTADCAEQETQAAGRAISAWIHYVPAF